MMQSRFGIGRGGRAIAIACREAGAAADERIDLDATLAGWERSYVEAALELCGGNVSQAARRLGINRTTLYNRMDTWHR